MTIAAQHERELVEILLAEPALVARAMTDISPDEVGHPGLRKVIEALYRLHRGGHAANLDGLRSVLDNERLLDRLAEVRSAGLALPDRAWAYQRIIERFQEHREHGTGDQIIQGDKPSKEPAQN